VRRHHDIIDNHTDNAFDTLVTEEVEEEDHVATAIAVRFGRSFAKLQRNGLLLKLQTGQSDILQDVLEFKMSKTFFDPILTKRQGRRVIQVKEDLVF
jgi:hypothetical protein